MFLQQGNPLATYKLTMGFGVSALLISSVFSIVLMF
jgi:hypothetical protein